MANPKIEVEIGAVIDGLRSGFGESVKIIETLEKQALELEQALKAATTLPEIQGLNAKLSQTKSALNQLKTSGIDPLTKATSNYNAVGVNFSRLIQDAPFGIIGVGNNITALAESFQQAGAQGQSFTKILGGIFSAGNLLTLGVSALVTGWTLYQQNATKTISLNDKIKESYDEIADSVENVAKKLATLDLVNEVITKQIDEVLKLNDSLTIFNLTADDFSKITTEAFSTLNEQQLSGIKSSLSELANDQLRIVGTQLKLTRKEAVQFIEGLKGNTSAFESLDPKIRDAVQSYNNLSEKIKLTNQQLDFYNDKSDKVDKNKEALERYSKAWDEYNLRQEEANILSDKFNQLQTEGEKKLKTLFEALAKAPDKPIKVEIKTDVVLDEDVADEVPFMDRLLESLNPRRFTEFEQRVAEFATNIRDLLQSNVTNAFIDLGYTIGEALGTGSNVIKAIGNSILKSFGRFLGQFGEQLIAYGVATIAFGKASLALSNPFTAIPAGGVAIAAGIALTAISGLIGSIGQGGFNGGSAAGSSGLGAGSSFIGGGAEGNFFTGNRDVSGEFVVRGSDLVYVLGQAGNRINKG